MYTDFINNVIISGCPCFTNKLIRGTCPKLGFTNYII